MKPPAPRKRHGPEAEQSQRCWFGHSCKARLVEALPVSALRDEQQVRVRDEAALGWIEDGRHQRVQPAVAGGAAEMHA